MKEKLMVLGLSLLLMTCKNTHPSEQSQSNVKQSVKKGQVLPPASNQWLTWKGKIEMPHIMLISGDEEYRSEEALPQLAKILSKHHGFNCTVLFAQDPEHPGIVDANYSNNIPGLEHLEHADMMILFTRFRALPNEQMKYIDDFLKSGKPLVGIRTATHAFRFDEIDFESSYLHYGNYYKGEDEWKGGFGRLVMGEHWISHHGRHAHQSTRGLSAPKAKAHPILNGISDGDIWGPTDVYDVRLPLPGDSNPIVLGQVVNRVGDFDENDPLLGMRSTDGQLPVVEEKEDETGKKITFDQNDPMMPIAWTKTYQLPGGKAGKCFATTIGASTDLLSEGTRRMLVNAVYWLAEKEVPQKADVALVGTYQPSRFAFHDDAYWEKKNMVITDLKSE